MTLPPKKTGTAWLRVADVAEMLGVSVNTVRRWTDAGRIVAYRSPGGHRRYSGDGRRDPGPRRGRRRTAPAARRGRTRATARAGDLRALVRAGRDLVALLSEAPWDVPEEVARRLCDLTDTPRCDILVREGRWLRLAVSVEGGELDTARTGATWSLQDWIPFDGPVAALPAAAAAGAARRRLGPRPARTAAPRLPRSRSGRR